MNLSHSIKSQLLEACQLHIQQRKERIQKRIKNIVAALSDETKSSAGDKHETSRAMLQLDRETLGKQLQEIEQLEQQLQRVNIESEYARAAMGSLVQTENGVYFISISIGAVTLDAKTYYCIAPGAPIGRLLLGKEAGDTFQFNGNTFRIQHIM